MAAPKKTRKAVILAVKQSAPGTPGTPTGSANAMLVSNLSPTPLAGDVIQREFLRSTLGGRPGIHVGQHVLLEFDIEIAGAGSAGGIPAYDPLLECCGFVATNDPGVKHDYALNSDSEDVCTVHYHQDGSRHVLTEVRGSVAFNWSVRNFPMMRFSLMGTYADPTAVANPTVDMTAWKDPEKVSTANTVFAIMGANPILAELTVDQGNTTVYRELVGREEPATTDRVSTGSLLIESPPLGTWNIFAVANADTIGPMTIEHGSAAGKKFTLTAPGVQILQPTYADQDGAEMVSANLNVSPTADDNEIAISVA